MLVIAIGHLFGRQHDADIGGVELMVDHRPVTNKTTQSQIAFDQRRQVAQPGGQQVVHLRIAGGDAHVEREEARDGAVGGVVVKQPQPVDGVAAEA
mgnify:CR=1 FL=1